MNLKDTLSKLDSALAPKLKTQKMTSKDFDAYVADQIAKAKGETEEDDKEKGAAKARKRLEHLRALLKLVTKADGPAESGAWTASAGGSESAAAIPVYEEGFEPPTYMPTLDEGTSMTGGQGTQGDSSIFSNMGDLNGKNPQTPAPAAGGPTSGTGTQGDESIFANPGALNQGNPIGKVYAEMQKTLDELMGTTKAKDKKDDAEKTEKGLTDDPTVWPRDLADPKFLKEGIAKRAEDWGVDPWAPTK